MPNDDFNHDHDHEIQPVNALSQAILDLLSAVPETTESPGPRPLERARVIRTAAARKAATVSGTLALPPGPLGFITIIPDLIAVWRIQAQMIADIAGAFGKTALLSREQMLYCLFRHAAVQVARDLMARAGERIFFHRSTLRVLQGVAQRLGVKVGEHVIARSVVRWLPVVGSLGAAGYAYYDTTQVGATTIELFQSELAPAPIPPGTDSV